MRKLIYFTLFLCLYSFAKTLAQCIIPIEFPIECTEINTGGKIITSLGNTHVVHIHDGRAVGLITASNIDTVSWTFYNTAIPHTCLTTQGHVSPCNTYSGRDLIENLVDCEQNVNQTGIIIQNSDLSVQNNITSNAVHTNNSVNQYTAGNSITLNPGFSVETNTFFLAETDDCQVTKMYQNECDNANFYGWFGGDDRPNFIGRNVGSGQSIMVNRIIVPDTFGMRLSSGFSYASTGIPYSQDVTLKLTIRNGQSEFLTSVNKIVPPSFSGGWVNFDLTNSNIILLADRTYIFTWYLVSGESIGVDAGYVASSSPYQNDIFCNTMSFSGTSHIDDGATLDDWNLWYAGAYIFHNIRLVGEY